MIGYVQLLGCYSIYKIKNIIIKGAWDCSGVK